MPMSMLRIRWGFPWLDGVGEEGSGVWNLESGRESRRRVVRIGFVPVEGRPVAVRSALSWLDLRELSHVREGAMHFGGNTWRARERGSGLGDISWRVDAYVGLKFSPIGP